MTSVPFEWRRMRGVLWALLLLASLAVPARAELSSGIKLSVDRPGVYAVPLDALRSVSGRAELPPVDEWRLLDGERDVLFRIEPGDGGAPRLLFLASTSLFRSTDPRDGRPYQVLRLLWEGGGGTALRLSAPDAATARALPPATVHRRVRFEEDVLRVPVTSGDADATDTLWYWATLNQQSSSRLEIELDGLPDRPVDGTADLEVALRVLGWSRTAKPDGVSQHRVDLFLDERKVGEIAFDRRRAETFEITVPAADLAAGGPRRLRVEVAERTLAGASDPFLDIVHLDWVELGYRSASPSARPNAPLLLDASDEPRWLSDPGGAPSHLLVAAAGWAVERRPDGDEGGGWVLPPTGATELWTASEVTLREPLAIEPLAPPVSVPFDSEYLVVAPLGLAPGAERLADLHRALGRRVAVVDSAAIFDHYGGGEERPEALRRFLREQHDLAGRLRWVLLVGDADWFEPDDLPPVLREPADRNRIPAWTYLSRYGPAASDHFYAADPTDESLPLFAVGRLPVLDPAVLDAYVSKLEAWVAAPLPPGRPSVLMLSDSSAGSVLQQERMRERLVDAPVELVSPEPGPASDAAAIAAFGRGPSLVYFGGHGSRYVWQLGDPEDPDPTTFFDREDVARLAPSVRQPVALSISCATAPFDHPSAGSLGEAMVLSGERGAVAFVGASAPLHTPPRFGEALVEGFVSAGTLGEAFVAAKRAAARAQVSHLYSLLGDPALPLPPQRPEGGAQEQ